MMIHILPLALAAPCLAAAALPAGAHTCSRSAFPVFRDAVHTMIATTEADTLLAGPGSIRYELERGDRGGPIYGQVVRVERIAGAGQLPAGTDRVVLVPWSYDESCRRTRWGASARWVRPGERGLFWASLRPREQWADGVPTFDVMEPFQTPFPQKGDVGDALLTVEQAFELLQLLPLRREIEADAARAMAPLMEWARAHPDLACRYPATEVLFVASDIGGLPPGPCREPDTAEGAAATQPR